MRENRSLAIILFAFAGMAIVAMSACVKQINGALPVGQVIFWRSITASPLIVLYILVRGYFPHAFYTRRPAAHGLRIALAMMAMACSFAALTYISIAMVTAIGFLAPVLVLPLAVIFLGETLSKRHIAATALGLVGVVIVIARAVSLPQEGALIGTGLALIFAVLMAAIRIVLKDLSRTEYPATIAIYFTIGGTVVGALSALWGWQAVPPELYPILPLMGLFGALGHILAFEAVARAPISILAPVEYSELIWAALLDLALFAIVPSPLALLGMLVITASGVLVWMDRRA